MIKQSILPIPYSFSTVYRIEIGNIIVW